MNKNWQDSYRDSLKSYLEVQKFFSLESDFSELKYECFLPVQFAQKIKDQGPESALWKQFIPTHFENADTGYIDPIGDVKQSKGNGIIQKYQNRILFTPTTNCPVICRYCFRKNQLSNKDEIFNQNISQLVDYINQDRNINEVILTGGDPLILSDSKLVKIFQALEMTQVEFVRIHTRTPIILPERINSSLINLLKKYSNRFKRFIFVLHTNHSTELDEDVSTYLQKLRDIPRMDLKTQSVLLKNVNDNYQDLHNLFQRIIEVGFTPYYLHHPDEAKGAMHFWLPLEDGRRLYNKLRGRLPGWAIPHYIIDNNNGQGKQLAFNPESFEFSGKLLSFKDL